MPRQADMRTQAKMHGTRPERRPDEGPPQGRTPQESLQQEPPQQELPQQELPQQELPQQDGRRRKRAREDLGQETPARRSEAVPSPSPSRGARARRTTADRPQSGRASAVRPAREVHTDDAPAALSRALAGCAPEDAQAVLHYLALDARQRRVVRSLIAELASHARRREGGR